MQRKQTVHRVEMSGRLEFRYNRRGTLDEYLGGFGKKPQPDLLQLTQECFYDEDGLRQQIKNTHLALLMNGISYDEGPYADHNKSLAALAKDVFRDSNEQPLECLERVLDRLRPIDGSPAETMLPRINKFGKYNFVYDPSNLISDELPTAGAILSQGIRRVPDDPENRFMIVHPLEPYIVACALLRMKGIMAYPSRAYTGEQGDDAYVPLISAIYGESEQTLATFRLLRVHPDIEAIEIWSDEAVMGAIHSMRAVSRANHLAVENTKQFIEGRELSEDEIANQLARIAEDLFQCYEKFRLPHEVEKPEQENFLIPQSFQAIFSHIFQSEAWKASYEQLRALPTGRSGPDLFLASRGISKTSPLLPIKPEHFYMILNNDQALLEHYSELRTLFVNAWAKAAKTAQEAAGLIETMLIDRINGGESEVKMDL